jgi:hypothetical protein
MARAIVSYDLSQIRNGAAADEYLLPIHIIFMGNDLVRIDHSEQTVTFLFSDSLGVIAQKITDAAVAAAVALGYTVARNGVLFPNVTKGS